MSKTFKIKELDAAHMAKIAMQWLKAKAPEDDVHTILLWMQTPNCFCMSVEDEKGTVYALFDIIEAPEHIKNMKVCFSPKHAFNFKGQKFSEFIEELENLMHVLISIFAYVVKLSDKWGIVKIYSADQHIGIIFADFAKELKRQSPDYGVRLFGKWVEITNPTGAKKEGRRRDQ